ncbi:MAG: TIGR01777 family oxidoreductase [Chitinophagaceae bacterium]|nr:TIGR01777 family oxidoreductase [Chitinophagaceae bacterium]
MKTVIIAGGTGLVGKYLSSFLSDNGYRVIVLTRNAGLQHSKEKGIEYAHWNPEKKLISTSLFDEAEYLINLSGANVASHRWTKARKQELVNSRVNPSALLSDTLRIHPGRIRCVINASAIGWYGADPQIPNPHPFTENSPNDSGFLGVTCKLWESAIMPVKDMGIRLIILRIGIVLTAQGGMLKAFMKPLHFGIAPVFGNGRQMISWIHIHDLARLFLKCMEEEPFRGIYNAVSPHPVSQKEFMKKMAGKKNRFSVLVPVPSFWLKILQGEMSTEILKSTTVSSRKLLESGFSFHYSDIDSALEDLVR